MPVALSACSQASFERLTAGLQRVVDDFLYRLEPKPGAKLCTSTPCSWASALIRAIDLSNVDFSKLSRSLAVPACTKHECFGKC